MAEKSRPYKKEMLMTRLDNAVAEYLAFDQEGVGPRTGNAS